MANPLKDKVIAELSNRYGKLKKLEGTQSLFDVGEGALRIYFRYSKLHPGGRTFYGLRKEDIAKLRGFMSFICFLWDGQEEPLFVSFEDYEEVFDTLHPASDGQYKAQIYLANDGWELYFARAGRFTIEGNLGWQSLELGIDRDKLIEIADLTHSQIQTLIGAIGASKNFDIWIPQSDRSKLDSQITNQFECCGNLPGGYASVTNILSEVDVVWIERGSAKIQALFEVEHSTPVYSGLLRFNDIHLVDPKLKPNFTIVANDERRALFLRQLSRPTFKASGLNELCAFMKYENVVSWHKRMQ